MVDEFTAEVKTIKKILRTSDQTYEIPRYQRGYSWKRGDVSTFWNDMMEEWSGLFIGTILLIEQEKMNERTEIIDGQQRMLTITILLSSIRDALRKIGGEQAIGGASDIQSHYIEFKDFIGSMEKTPKVQVAKNLKGYFQRAIIDYTEGKLPDGSTDEEKRVRTARQFFDTAIRKELGQIKGDVEKISWLLTTLLRKVERLKVVRIGVGNPDDAYTVFESVNAKGAALTLADILKSLIFRRIPRKGDEDIAQKQWDKIHANLDGTGFTLTRFIRYYWLSNYEFLPESKLYSAIKKKLEVDKAITWEGLLDDLVSHSDFLRMLKEADAEDFSKPDYNSPRRVANALTGISLMNVSQVYVLLLAIHRNRGMKKKWERELEMLERFCFHYHAIGKQQAVRVEKKYSEYAIKIEKLNEIENDDDRSTSLETVLREMRDDLVGVKREYVQLDNFTQRFNEELDYSKPSKRLLVKYTLSRINHHYENGTGEMSVDLSMINLEHILPQNPKNWGLSKEDVEDYVNKIGNLTMISKKINSTMGNKGLKEKLVLISGSELSINANLIDFIENHGNKWTDSEIYERGSGLAKLSFNEIWDL